ncbi:UNVERIFIED_CONTAM: hypothetical protein PYX00_005352 [Menopon gallinae]|uniref:U2 snRNP-associated SURP motif-containing protein n=1 Tax=Menopon gallinae TaxID=328185 RepID=A0AAW2HR47_9NEOP
MADKATMKQIAEQKLKAFSIGTMGKRPLSKREIEEQRKKEEEEAAAHAFQEFVETFTDVPGNKAGKVWVKAGTYDAGKRQEDTREKGKLYKPQSRIAETVEKNTAAERAQEYAKLLSDKKPEKPSKKKSNDKKKSNLELFKEELKMIQEEREERHKYKGALKSELDFPQSSTSEIPSLMSQRPVILPEDQLMGSFDCGDPNTTNIYLGNLNPKITEQQLMELFGRYGPLASIKIMWPRTDEEKARGKNCGFVAFMNRKDGERAMRNLNGKDVMQYEMKLGWGKTVPIPHHPIYIPPSFVELTMPPPPSGLPFNAQPARKDKHRVYRMVKGIEPLSKEELDKVLYNATVKVVVPTDRQLLMLINRTIEFVIREGPMFEAMIMNRELLNPMYRFLFENQSPAHIYYRWKLFSILQGDSQTKWHTEEFRMFKGGSIWKPPPMNQYTQGMPDDLIDDKDDFEPRKGTLSNTQRDRLEDLLRNIGPERIKVAEAMVFCIEHSEAAEEICDCIAESLSLLHTPIHKKIARLYLISDILHNCGVKVTNASYFRRGLETRLMQIFADVNLAYKSLESRLKAEGFKMRVMAMFRAWEEWAVYPRDFLIRLQNTFLGLSNTEPEPEPEAKQDTCRLTEIDPDIDGAPLEENIEDDDLDGLPLDGAALLKTAIKSLKKDEEDIDGIPMDYIDGEPMEDDVPQTKKKKTGAFVPSKWETVDPEQIEAQAMTTSKWDLLEPPQQEEESQCQSQEDSDNDHEDDSQGELTGDSLRTVNEERRAVLRDIEVKVMQYQDELESGSRKTKTGWTIAQQVEHFRRKLMKRAEKGRLYDDKDDKEDQNDKRRYHSPSYGSSRKSKRSRSDSSSPPPSKRSHRSHSRSDSPTIRKSSSRRSRSPYSKKSRAMSSPSLSPTYSRKSRLSPSSPYKKSSARGLSPVTPPRTKSSSQRRGASPQSPGRSRRREHSPSSSPRLSSKKRDTSPTRGKHSKHRGSDSPPRKHKERHKYKY